jgi:hypothetical protein
VSAAAAARAAQTGVVAASVGESKEEVMAEVLEKQVATTTSNVTLTTTGETVIISSGAVKVPSQTCLVHVRAWAQLTTGTGTTAVTPRIRRNTTTSGTLVSEANAETLKAAAGGTEPFMVEATERRSDQDTVEYSLTLQQTGASGDGTGLQAAIEVEILSG